MRTGCLSIAFTRNLSYEPWDTNKRGENACVSLHSVALFSLGQPQGALKYVHSKVIFWTVTNKNEVEWSVFYLVPHKNRLIYNSYRVCKNMITRNTPFAL